MILKLLVGFLFFTLFLIMSHSSRHDCNSPASSNVIFKPGLLPLVITAPHGGWKRPTTIPDRVKNGSLVLTDLHTAEIAQDICERIEQHYGHLPHLVVNTISRRKADPNRDIDEGTETEGGRHIWIEYHSRIKDAIEALHRRHSFGLLIDIHGTLSIPFFSFFSFCVLIEVHTHNRAYSPSRHDRAGLLDRTFRYEIKF
jgi:N-formylglutamate amidohydrolase